ncbi:protein-tyrosine-phosphatase [Malassezia equina]|uniref:Protein-tyrosine-phosphatase n=1 Tax=Malassezia equina TaxID=1381935 RepID=A0AAF0IXR7_9BASI|nr:protein-tyrosine-phosphatase [Malassezia equina]
MAGAEATLCQEAYQLLARLNTIDAQRVGDPEFPTTQFDEFPAANRYANVYPSQKINVLVNLTPLVEHGFPKSDQYWPTSPSEPLTVDHLWKVSLLSEKDAHDSFDAESASLAHNVPHLRVRHLRIESLVHDRQHEVTQMHFEGWPDHGVLDLQVLFGLLEAMHALQSRSAERPPVWVHCSAGIGRSGTLIGAYLLQQRAETLASQQPLSMAGDVTAHMRKYRAGTVQTSGQLVVLALAAAKMQATR